MLRELSEELAEAALLAVRDGDSMVDVAHEDVTDHSIAMRRLLGVRRHLHSTSLGKAYLSPPCRRRKPTRSSIGSNWVRMTPTTITETEALKAEFRAIRTRGYSIVDAENEPDVMCFGAAIRDDRGRSVPSASPARWNASAASRTSFPPGCRRCGPDVSTRCFVLSQAAGTRMLGRGEGKIINIGSLLSFQGGINVPRLTPPASMQSPARRWRTSGRRTECR